jgi:hypothetical protein
MFLWHRAFEQGEPAIFLYLIVSEKLPSVMSRMTGRDYNFLRAMETWLAGRRDRTPVAYFERGRHRAHQPAAGARLRFAGAGEQHPETGIMVIERFATVVSPRLQSSHLQVVAMLEYGLSNGT